MILYTIEPYERIFLENNTAKEQIGVSSTEFGFVQLKDGKIDRIISTDPKVYLDKRFTPGQKYR